MAAGPAAPMFLFICASIAEHSNLDELAATDETVRAGIEKISPDVSQAARWHHRADLTATVLRIPLRGFAGFYENANCPRTTVDVPRLAVSSVSHLDPSTRSHGLDG